MRLLIINTNGLETDTRAIQETARRYALPSTEIVAVHPPRNHEALGGYGAVARSTEATLHSFPYPRGQAPRARQRGHAPVSRARAVV